MVLIDLRRLASIEHTTCLDSLKSDNLNRSHTQEIVSKKRSFGEIILIYEGDSIYKSLPTGDGLHITACKL